MARRFLAAAVLVAAAGALPARSTASHHPPPQGSAAHAGSASAPRAHASFVSGRPGVAALQVALRAKGLYSGTVDGVMGPITREGVRQFQARKGLAVDGIVGPMTRRALGRRGRPLLGRRVIRRGHRGWDVAALQFLLARSGFASGPFDGHFGPRGATALVRFQEWAGLSADGLAGPATIAAARRPPPSASLNFLAPVAGAPTDGFGPRGAAFHTGLDYPLPRGTDVGAAGRGCVSSAGYDGGGYGNLVVIDHGAGMTSWYAHLNRITVDAGECVTAGTRIGTVGSTGNSTGPHLHFELRLRGAAVDPLTGF